MFDIDEHYALHYRPPMLIIADILYAPPLCCVISRRFTMSRASR